MRLRSALECLEFSLDLDDLIRTHTRLARLVEAVLREVDLEPASDVEFLTLALHVVVELLVHLHAVQLELAGGLPRARDLELALIDHEARRGPLLGVDVFPEMIVPKIDSRLEIGHGRLERDLGTVVVDSEIFATPVDLQTK